METQMGTKLSLLQRLQLRLYGVAPLPFKTRKDKDGKIMAYAFKCAVHGVVEDYINKNNKTLKCPLCAGKRVKYTYKRKIM